MFKSIPMSAIVNIVPSALSAGGNALALNGAMIVDGLLDQGASVREITFADDFKSIFKPEDIETVQAYFKGVTIATQRPRKLFVAVKQNEAYPATLTSAKLDPYQASLVRVLARREARQKSLQRRVTS